MQQANAIDYHKTRDFGKKLNATIEFLKQNFKPLFKSLLFISGPFVILGSLLLTQTLTFFMGLSQQLQFGLSEPDSLEMFTNSAYLFVALLFLIVGGTAIVASTYDYMKLYEEKGSADIEVNEVWERVKKSFWSVMGTMLLFAALFAIAYVIILVPVVLFAPATPFLTIIGVFVVIVVVIYASIACSFVFIIRSYENIGFFPAVSRSFKLIQSKWWSTFGLLFVVGMIRGTISSLFIIPWYALFIIQTIHSAETLSFQEPSFIYQIISFVSLALYMIANYLLYCLPLIAIAFQYFNLVEMKEARGLMDKIEVFGNRDDSEDEEEHY